RGRALIGPKCRRELRHFGVDYGKPGIAVRCRACGAVSDEPVANFACLDCAATTPTGESRSADWYHYDLTEDGIRTLRDGCLPRLTGPGVGDDTRRTFSRSEFRLLAAEAMRVAERHGRPFAVGRLSAETKRELVSPQREAAFSLAVEIAIGWVRESDFVAADGALSILVGLPET